MIDILLLMFLFLFINFGVGTFIAAYSGLCLSFYLKKSYYNRWEKLMLFPNFGAGMANPAKTFPYVFNKLDTGDNRILKLKKRIRYWILHAVISFVLILVLMVLATIIAAFQGRLVG